MNEAVTHSSRVVLIINSLNLSKESARFFPATYCIIILYEKPIISFAFDSEMKGADRFCMRLYKYAIALYIDPYSESITDIYCTPLSTRWKLDLNWSILLSMLESGL